MLRFILYILISAPFLLFCSCTEKETKLYGLEAKDQISYNFHVRPILSDNCFACHGPDGNKRESDLRLDTEEGAYAALKDNPAAHAIVPGDPQASEVVLRILSSDPSEKMPPPSSNLTLTEAEIRSEEHTSELQSRPHLVCR